MSFYAAVSVGLGGWWIPLHILKTLLLLLCLVPDWMHHPAGTLSDAYQMRSDVKKKKKNAEWLRFSQLTHKTTQQDV